MTPEPPVLASSPTASPIAAAAGARAATGVTSPAVAASSIALTPVDEQGEQVGAGDAPDALRRVLACGLNPRAKYRVIACIRGCWATVDSSTRKMMMHGAS